MIWYEKWLRNFMIIIHQLLFVVYMPALHISFTYTVTGLTSTLIRPVKCYINNYHEKNNKKNKTHVSPPAQLLHVHNVIVHDERHYFHQCSLTDTKFMKRTCITLIISAQYRHVHNL